MLVGCQGAAASKAALSTAAVAGGSRSGSSLVNKAKVKPGGFGVSGAWMVRIGRHDVASRVHFRARRPAVRGLLDHPKTVLKRGSVLCRFTVDGGKVASKYLTDLSLPLQRLAHICAGFTEASRGRT